MGGVPVEEGGLPSQLEWRPVHRTVNNPDLFANLVQNLEASLAMGGLALRAVSQGSAVVYYAGDRMVAKAIQVPDGFIGTIYAEPMGKLHMKQAAEEVARTALWYRGYQGYGNPGSSPGGGATGTVVGLVVVGLALVGIGVLVWGGKRTGAKVGRR